MEQATRFVPMLLLLGYVIKISSNPNLSISEALIALGLVGLYALQEYKLIKSDKEKLLNQLDIQKKELSDRIFLLEDKVKDIDDIKSHITAIKTGSQLNSQKQQSSSEQPKNFRF